MAGRRAVGLDIGTSAVRAAELSLGRGGFTLERFGQVGLPPGAVRDGEVLDPVSVSQAIKQLWSSAKFSSRSVILGVANQRVIVRQVDLPWMPQEELRKALAFHVQDFIPMPVDQAILDFHPVEEITGESGTRLMRLLLVAASREMVMNAITAVRRAGLRCTKVDLTPFAVLRALGELDHVGVSTGDAEALVDVGASVTNIVVHQNGTPRFVRILLMGGDTITEAVADRMGVPADQAETVKQEMGLAPAGSVPEQAHPAGRVIETTASAFIDEVRGSLDYYLAQPHAMPLRRLVVSGGGARLEGLVQRLSTATRLPVEPGTPISRLRVGKTGLTQEQLSYVDPVAVVPVGLAMGVAA